METIEKQMTLSIMTPSEGSKYITQSDSATTSENRLFLKSRVKLPTEDGSEWRDATAEEAAAYDAKVKAEEEKANLLAGN